MKLCESWDWATKDVRKMQLRIMIHKVGCDSGTKRIVSVLVRSPRAIRIFKKLLGDAGLPTIRFHDIQHTAVTLILLNGIPILVVSRRLGHAKPSITLDVYGNHLPGIQNEAAALLDELVTPIAAELQHLTIN